MGTKLGPRDKLKTSDVKAASLLEHMATINSFLLAAHKLLEDDTSEDVHCLKAIESAAVVSKVCSRLPKVELTVSVGRKPVHRGLSQEDLETKKRFGGVVGRVCEEGAHQSCGCCPWRRARRRGLW